MPLYEYACPACAASFSRLRPLSAAGESAPCPRCGAAAARTPTLFAVHRRSEARTPSPPQPVKSGPELRQRYPHLPLLCHMEPQAAERWIAKAEGREERYLERQARRQEAVARASEPPPPPAPADDNVSHGHHFGHVHTHAATPTAEAGR